MRATFAAILLLVSGCASGTVRQGSSSATVSTTATFVGSWVFVADKMQPYTPDWRRAPRQVVQPRFLEPPATPGLPGEDPTLANRRYLVERQRAEDRWAAANRARDASYFAIADALHQEVSALQIDVTPTAVIFTKNGQRLQFSTTGVKERSPGFSEPVDIRTRREGPSLHQQLTNNRGFKATQVYTLANDGRTMSIVTMVLSPLFKPPIETTLTYRRPD